MKKYTIKEIDELRNLVSSKVRYNVYFSQFRFIPSTVMFRYDMPDDNYIIKTTEEQLRTLMVAGITAQDIKDEFYEQEKIMKSGNLDEFNS